MENTRDVVRDVPDVDRDVVQDVPDAVQDVVQDVRDVVQDVQGVNNQLEERESLKRKEI